MRRSPSWRTRGKPRLTTTHITGAPYGAVHFYVHFSDTTTLLHTRLEG